MALLMVHLLVADLWAQGHPEYLDSPEYYLGAISPDAIHIDRAVPRSLRKRIDGSLDRELRGLTRIAVIRVIARGGDILD